VNTSAGRAISFNFAVDCHRSVCFASVSAVLGLISVYLVCYQRGTKALLVGSSLLCVSSESLRMEERTGGAERCSYSLDRQGRQRQK
jgi:hypothetical protein